MTAQRKMEAGMPNVAGATAEDWQRIGADLDAQGFAVMPGLLEAEECRTLSRLYPADEHFRSRIVMGRHGFGRGEYKYFAYPLPARIAHLRTDLYAHLAPIANAWNEAMRVGTRFPARHAEFIAQCHAAGQGRPTPLLLQYAPGDYNCLHQDLYGAQVFPLQVAILLARPGEDFAGGEFAPDRAAPAHAVTRVRGAARAG